MTYRKHLYRNPDNARIAGVCSGLAEYFGIETWLVRILTVTGFFLLAGPFVLVSYVAAWFILDKKPKSFDGSNSDISSAVPIHGGKGWVNESATASVNPVEIKTKVWQAGEAPKEAFFHIQAKFRDAEQRLRAMESHVTSREFQLNREIGKL